MLIDTHGAAVIEPVYELLEYVLKRTEVKAVMLERDQNYPDFSEIIAELNEIRAIAARTQPGLLKVANGSADSHSRRQPISSEQIA